jgi:long-chain acyl-CoA synthetase
MPVALEEQLKLSGLITNVLVYGADREFNVALVVPNEAAVRARAAELGLALGDDLSRSDAARALMQRELDDRSVSFAAFERPRKCMLLGADFSVENGLLTPTLKVRRATVLERYRNALEALYREQPEARAQP